VEAAMLSDHWVSLFAVGISFAGLMLVLVQLRRGTIQREAQSLVQILDINRQLMTLGFSHPDLFKVLDDKTGADPLREERYLQLWLNQMWLIHTFLWRSALKTEFKACLLRDFGYFAENRNFQRHWRLRREFYPASFVKLLDAIMKEKELSVLQTAPEYSGD
jgi:hypothetical protein